MQNKWGPKEKTIDTWKGIAVSDRALNSFQEQEGIQTDGEQKVPVYDKTTISENQQAALKLPPNFTTYETISERKMEIEIETAMVKTRWEDRNKKTRNGKVWNEEWQDQEL